MSTGVDFADVAGVSGCGQQHGSVYWRVGARDMLRKANPGSHSKKVLSYLFSLGNLDVCSIYCGIYVHCGASTQS